MANTYLTRTPSSASNRKTWTWSGWVKRGELSASNQVLFQARDGSFPEKLQFNSAGKLEYDHDIAGTDYTVRSDMVFRDINAFYHIVVAKDTTQATETNRIKVYVNGEQQTLSEYQLGYPPQNYDGAINNNVAHHIGSNNGSEFFDGSMSHVHFCDGQQLAPTVFGETDSTTGEWKIKTSPSFTPGTNGFTVLKDGNTITDQSANSNNFSLAGGTLTKTEDCPSNVFATLNPLDNKFSTDAVFSNGNNYVAAGGAGNGRFYSTLGMVSGKYYCEIKNVSGSGGTPLFAVAGTSNYALSGAGSPLSSQLYDYALYNGNVYNNDATVGGTWGTPSDGNIIGIAINLDNEQSGLNKLYFSINGVWQNGADPSNLTSVTGVVGITKPENMVPVNPGYGVGAYFFACGDDNSYAERRFATNFGNGFFQTTAVSSAGTNASGIGIFEYDVPTGFTALSTKGLNL